MVLKTITQLKLVQMTDDNIGYKKNIVVTWGWITVRYMATVALVIS